MVTKDILKIYANNVIKAISDTDFEALAQIADRLFSAKDEDITVYTAGNGGSAATASHICNDLLKGCSVCGNIGYKTECLSDSNAVITCLVNDFDYNSIYSIQLNTKAHRGDILIVYSGSGNSENIIRAVTVAKEKEMLVIGFTGRDGGRLKALCDISLVAPSDSMEQIEDLHMLYTHALSDCLQKKLTEKAEKSCK